MQGVGHILYEEMIAKNCKVYNPNLVDYKIPTVLYSFDIKILIVEIPDDRGPMGTKGIAAAPIIDVAPAIVNAIFRATSVWVNELPVNLERLYFAILRKNNYHEIGHYLITP